MPEASLRPATYLVRAPFWTATLAAVCLLTGCRHQPLPAPPPPAVAPPVTSSTVTVITPLPSLPPDKAPDVQQAAPPAPPAPPVEQKVRRTRRIRRKATPPKAEIASASPAASSTPGSAAAVSGATPGAASLGELSAGTAISLDQRNRMLTDIAKQEARLARLPTSTGSEAAAIQTQIRTFLARARQAVAQNDLDGAETLNTKARVLLDELQGE